MKTTVAALPDGWKARGDEYHWDHTDGCFIERDFAGSKTVYVLYADDCTRVSGTKSLTTAFQSHNAFTQGLAQGRAK